MLKFKNHDHEVFLRDAIDARFVAVLPDFADTDGFSKCAVAVSLPLVEASLARPWFLSVVVADGAKSLPAVICSRTLLLLFAAECILILIGVRNDLV